MFGGIGVGVAAFYYVMNLRNTSKSHELQVTMQVLALFSSKDFWSEFWEMMGREWQTLDEYQEKYGKIMDTTSAFITFEELGVLLKRKLIDVSVPWDLYGNFVLVAWEKYKPIILEMRRSFAPDYSLWTEYLVNELSMYAAEHPESQVLPSSK